VAVGRYVCNHATDVQIDVDHLEDAIPVFAQFKKVTIGRVGPMNVAVLQAKAGKSADLALEAEMLQTLKDAGLRTVPVYDTPQRIAETGQMSQKAILGNFLDCKEGFTEKQNYNIVAGLFGLAGVNREADSLAPVKERVEKMFALKAYPENIFKCIGKALNDFKKIRAFLTKSYISDLQGIIEFATGKFYIIDPLKLGPIADANQMESACVQYVNHAIELLEAVESTLKRVK
jgi:hypothetical protein